MLADRLAEIRARFFDPWKTICEIDGVVQSLGEEDPRRRILEEKVNNLVTQAIRLGINPPTALTDQS